jgi:membrane-associated HD superfamily phosphohydrolase
METASPTMQIEALYEKSEQYAKTAIQLAKLKSLDTTTVVVTAMISRLSVIVMMSLFVLVLNIGIALYLGEVLGKVYYGFFIIAGFYLLCGLILHFFLQKWIQKPLSDFIIKEALQ